MRRSQIRDLLSVATRPEIISFAGGFPNPETFPLEDLKSIMQEVLDKEGYAALQYGSTDGVVSLRQGRPDAALRRPRANRSAWNR